MEELLNILRLMIALQYFHVLVSEETSPFVVAGKFVSIVPSNLPAGTVIHRMKESLPELSPIPLYCLTYNVTVEGEPNHFSLSLDEVHSESLSSGETPIVFNRTTGEFIFEGHSANISTDDASMTYNIFIDLLTRNLSCHNIENDTMPIRTTLQIKTEFDSPPKCFKRRHILLQGRSSLVQSTGSLLQETSKDLDGRILQISQDSSRLVLNATLGEIHTNISDFEDDTWCSQRCTEILTCSYMDGGSQVTEYAVVSIIPEHLSENGHQHADMLEPRVAGLSVNRSATYLTKVYELTNSALVSFRADSELYRGAIASDEILNVVFVNDTDLLRSLSLHHVIYHVRHVYINETAEDLVLNISISGDAYTCDKLYRCSSFESGDGCEGACGYGAPAGLCQWRQQSSGMAVSDSYSTCSPNLKTCPDKICEDWERIHGICWQDCTQDDIRFGGWRNEETGKGISNAVGPCSCNNEGVCSCRNVNVLAETNDTQYAQPNTGESTSYKSRDIPRCGSQCIITVSALLPITVGIAVFLAVTYRKHRRATALRSLSLGVKPGNLIELQSRLTSSSTYYVSEELVTWKKAARRAHEAKWEFSRNKLIFDEVLGEGEYGRVVKAQALNIRGHTGYTPVAVKMMKNSPSSVEVQDFLSELELLKQVNHPNVIRLLGAVTLEGPFLLIVEFCEHGALRTFLRANRKRAIFINDHHQPHEGEAPAVDIGSREIISYAWQICRGMDYLSCLKFIHRDLAARNILVTSEFVMKISDFGLSRDIYEGDTYVKQGKGKIPVKWMAVEVLYDNVYTSKSDVWSFGVLLWEMITMGATPYPGVTSERLYQILKDGYRMERPDECSDEIYEVMLKCWRENPNDRPTFADLCEMFESLLSEHVVYLDCLGDPTEEASDDE